MTILSVAITSPHALPFVVAVTGHRDIHPDDVLSVCARIQDLIELILAALPHTPIHFLSALADGADQLFAQQVLAKKEQLLECDARSSERIKLIATLPANQDEYCRSQARNGFVARFTALANRADSVFTISDDATSPPLSGNPRADHHPAPYARLARYLNTHAHLLVAIWDGRMPEVDGVVRKAGGTLDVVLTRIEGFDRVTDSRSARRLAEQERGAVVHIETRRAALPRSPIDPVRADKGCGLSLWREERKDKERTRSVAQFRSPGSKWTGLHLPGTFEWLRTPVKAAALFQERYVWRRLVRRAETAVGQALPPPALAVLHGIWTAGREIDSFNQRHQQALQGRRFMGGGSYRQMLVESAQNFVKTLDPDAEEHKGAAIDRSGWPLAPLVQAYVVAGVLAQNAKQTWGWRWLLIAIGAVVAGASSSFKLLYPPRGELIESAAFVIGAGMAVVTYLWVSLSNQRNAYLEYRALAEGLRFQMYWMAAGNHALVTDHYVQKFRSELGWVRRALDGLMVLPRIPCGSALAVARGWIDDQNAYLDGRQNERRDKQNTMATTLGNNLLLLGLALAVSVLLLSFHSNAIPAVAVAALIVGMKLTSAVGAAWLSYNGKMAHGETLKQVEHLKGVYLRAGTALDGIDRSDQTADAKEDQARDLLIALGKEALAENANWLSNYQQRKVTWAGR